MMRVSQNRLIGTLLALICHAVAIAQLPCDPKDVRRLEREYIKARGDTKKHGGAECALQLSRCYVGVNDSLHRDWLLKAIDARKKFYQDRNMTEKIGMIRDVGFYNEELGDEEQAEYWFMKWTKVECEVAEPYYHHGRSLLRLRRSEDALTELRIAERKGSTRNDLDSLLSEATKASAIGGERNERVDSTNLSGRTWHFESNSGLRGFFFNYGRYDFFIPNPKGLPIRNEMDLKGFFRANRDVAIQVTYSQGDEYYNIFQCVDTIRLSAEVVEMAEPFTRVVIADVAINTVYKPNEVRALRRHEPFLRENNFALGDDMITFWYYIPNQFITSITCSRP